MAGTTIQGSYHHTTQSTAGPHDLASGATTSSKGTWLVCRLPLAAFRLWTSGVKPRRPAAVIQYESQGPGAHCPAGLSLEPVTTSG